MAFHAGRATSALVAGSCKAATCNLRADSSRFPLKIPARTSGSSYPFPPTNTSRQAYAIPTLGSRVTLLQHGNNNSKALIESAARSSLISPAHIVCPFFLLTPQHFVCPPRRLRLRLDICSCRRSRRRLRCRCPREAQRVRHSHRYRSRNNVSSRRPTQQHHKQCAPCTSPCHTVNLTITAFAPAS